MKATKGLIIWAILMLPLFGNLYAQVTSVNYQMKYDTSTCLYDCYIIINSGSATTVSQRIQFNAQYTIVVPFGTTISIDTSYMPLIANESYTGTVPQTWNLSTNHNYPAGTPEYTYHSIVPNILPQAHYNNLSPGDTVRLFSLSISPTVDCAEDIRIWENGVDPSSSDPDMAGLDFSNGFTIGGTTQLYNANSTQLFPPSPIIVSTTTECISGIEIDLTATTSGCQSPLSYAWTGPNSYTSTSEDVSIVPSTPADNGTYKVVITDNFGCKDSVTIVATSKPNAGADLEVCAGTTDTLVGTAPSTGTWAQAAGNPAGATLTQLLSGQARVVFTNSASGTYYFVYSIPGCKDTMSVLVNALPNATVSGPSAICVGETTNLSPTTGGTWVSSNAGIATVTNAGLVTGISSGTVTFTFTDTVTGCSKASGTVTVNPAPAVTNTGNSTICITGTTNLTPTSGGTWTSSNPAVATVTNAGVVTGVSAGTVTLTYLETSSGCSNSLNVTVSPRPTVSVTGSDSICINTTTTLSPSTGGTWSSSNNLVATVNNSGIVTGLAVGQVVFTFTETASQCVSDPTDTVTVLAKPTVSITGSNRICINATTTLSPTTGGTWVSNNPSVATVTNAGVVTSVAQGNATFTFTSTATGCSSTTPAVIVDPKPTVSSNQSNICVGGTTSILPSSGGTWTNHTPSIISRSGSTVTGLATGTGKLTFLETGTGCVSDTLTIIVEPGPVVSITGDDEICVGLTTQLSPTTGGTWASSDPSIASVNNSGLVTGIAAGVVTFVFTSTTTFCSSAPTDPITVIARPTVTVASNNICQGATTTLTPSSGGTWSSSNAGVASVTNGGVVTGISPGSATFTFTDTTTGCVSNASTPVTVDELPTSSFTGPSSICVGFTTSVSPTAGGTWTSSNPAVATVTNTGVVTAVSAGTVTLTYTQTSTNCPAAPLNLTVNPIPTVSVTGDTAICIGETTTLSPTTGGTWVSNNNSVATVTNAGVVTGVAQGSATFTFLSSAGCPSEPTEAIAVNGPPTVNISGDDEICIGETTTLNPATGGIWTSNDTLIATVNAGIVTAIAAGSTTFSFVDTITGCGSDDTAPLTVDPKPTTVISGPTSICVGAQSTISPTVGGTWASTNPAVATVNNSGIITGVAPGTVRFIYTNSATGCVSDTSATLTVTPGPIVSITGDDEICINETTTLSPTTGGTWESSNASVASVTNVGIVTGVSAGSATFTFTQNGTGCKSLATAPIIVHPKPTVSIDGTDIICIGGTTNLLPNSGGTWVSNNVSIATVTNAGVVTGVAQGSTTFVFTDATTQCPSDDTAPVTVSPAPNPVITGQTEICVGGTTTLSPSSGGVWVSSDPSVATVNNSGIVTSIGPGRVTFTFTETATGCSSEGSTDTLTISNCSNPDFNATFVDVEVDGDVSTNDMVAGGTTYGGSPVLSSSPAGSVASITMNGDGTYTFTGNTVGVYVYLVQVCVPPQLVGCPTSRLTITVTDFLKPDLYPIANTDIAVTEKDSAVTLISLENDRCVVVTGCNLDATSVTITDAPSNGGAVANGTTGDITYTPNAGFVGKDTLTYRVCVDGEPANCATAIQIITVYDPSSLNSTDAADDFAVTAELTPVAGNVSTNDTDVEGDNLSVTPLNLSVAAGDLTLDAAGNYLFTPAEDFYGPVEFIYTSCDDNADQACANATLHILVVPDLSIRVRVYLEGSLMNNANQIGTTHTRPLMRDNLRSSPFNGSTYIPTADPYVEDNIFEGGNPYNLDLASKYIRFGPGLDTATFKNIPNPSSVFSKTGEDAITDWVFVELRSKSDSTNILATRSGLVQRDGDVADLNGTRGLRFPGIPMDDYYVVVRHRNHLGAMTAAPKTPQQLWDLVDFTKVATGIYDFGFIDFGGGVTYDYTGLAQKSGMKPNTLALWAGDFDGNKKVKADNPNDDLNSVFSDVFFHPDNVTLNVNFDFAYGYRSADYDMNAKVKYDNPNDDKNMLYGQLLFYPLNTFFLSNFDFFIEQIP